jgi:FkbM family methyltransferase
MNTVLYKLCIALLRGFGSVEILARPLDAFCRVWQRHRKLRLHLRTLGFDGVIDGGANIGEFSGIVCAALPGADLICVEPHPDSAAILRKRGYKVVEAALWKEPGRLRLRQPTARSTSCTVIRNNVAANDGAPPWDVDAVRLDGLEISGSRLLVKLDLQGAEPEALEGMGALWERCVGLLVEVSIGNGGTYEKMRELLARHGFYEYSTTNELAVDGRVIEADKLWLRKTR